MCPGMPIMEYWGNATIMLLCVHEELTASAVILLVKPGDGCREAMNELAGAISNAHWIQFVRVLTILQH